MHLILFGIYLFLAVFNAGNMTTLQLQHYGIYPFIGKENFKEYMRANNRAAFFPSILPALLLLVVNIVLVFSRPSFMSIEQAIFSLFLNIIALISTFRWQRKLQSEMAETGYNEEKINFLISTNWIRTFLFITQAVMAVVIVINAVS
jgi:predicted ABC-type exoprotein transport system permease subunit